MGGNLHTRLLSGEHTAVGPGCFLFSGIVLMVYGRLAVHVLEKAVLSQGPFCPSKEHVTCLKPSVAVTRLGGRGRTLLAPAGQR